MSITIPATGGNIKLNTQFDFKPFYTPNEMLSMGIYGGAYFGRHRHYLDDPGLKFIFAGVPDNKYKNWDYTASINFFTGVTVQRLERSLNMPPALKEVHPLGWFQWYMNYYAGRTSRADAWRANQWLQSINADWWYIETDNYSGGGNRFTDLTFNKERRQRMLEFGVDPTVDPKSYGCGFEF